MTIIYGVDAEKPVSPSDVRDAIVECFTQAHSEALSELKNYNKDLSDAEFEQIKRINVEQLIRNFFEETGGNFDKPTRDSIMPVLDKLREFAKNFRSPEVIQKHFEEICILLKKI